MNKIRVQRANVILDVDEDQRQDYLDKGFSVIDVETGKVLESAIPTDIPTLQKMVRELLEANKKLEEDNEKLKSRKSEGKRLDAEQKPGKKVEKK